MLLLHIIGLKLVIITFTLGINEKSFSRLWKSVSAMSLHFSYSDVLFRNELSDDFAFLVSNDKSVHYPR